MFHPLKGRITHILLAAFLLLPFIQPALAEFYPAFLRSIYLINDRDEGLIWGISEAPVLDISVTDKDITFTVHLN